MGHQAIREVRDTLQEDRFQQSTPGHVSQGLTPTVSGQSRFWVDCGSCTAVDLYARFADTFQFDSLLSAQIAYMSNRAYVFQPYIWDERALARTVKVDGRWRSSLIPLNAFIAGPTAGAPFPNGTGQTVDGAPAPWPAPRAVNYDYFNYVCPPWRRKHVNVRAMRPKYRLEETWDTPTGDEILKAYAKELSELPHECVVIGGRDHVFTFP